MQVSTEAQANEYKTSHLDHLGLVAGMFDELKIGDTLDELIPQDLKKRQVSCGQIAKAMVLNGLGFVNQTWYLAPHFFEKVPIKRLIDPGIEPRYLNDEVLGRFLDTLYHQGLEGLYCKLSTQALGELALLRGVGLHLDSTTFHLHGQYNTSGTDAHKDTITVTRGYSKDHRSDLKQAVLNLMVDNKAGIPFLMSPADGNSSDKTGFRELIDTHIEPIKAANMAYLVTDSALYNQTSLNQFERYPIQWITRVPETSKDAQWAIQHVSTETMRPLAEGYQYTVLGNDYAGIAQRWLVVRSQAAKERTLVSTRRTWAKATCDEYKRYERLCRQPFACRADAEQAHAKLINTLTYAQPVNTQVITQAHYATKGRPAQHDQLSKVTYRLTGSLVFPMEAYQQAVERKSRFIIATNECDAQTLSDSECFTLYKDQNRTVERGFRFLKDPMFLADSLYLKSPQRIMALMMIMTLCLMVYAALEYKLRQQLKDQQQSFPHQSGKMVQNPTARWVFCYFRGIDVLLIANQPPIVVNKNKHHTMIIGLLGPPYQRYYS